MSRAARWRIVILGSCVSRDTVSAMDPDTTELVAYVARQSFASIADPVVEGQVQVPDNVTSQFQRRSLTGSFRGDALARLRDAATDGLDLVIIDLTDERLGLFALDEGGVVTRSVETSVSGLDRTLSQRGKPISFGSAEHFTRWCGGLELLAQTLDDLGLAQRTVVIAPPWAKRTESGARVKSVATSRRTFARHVRRYLEYLRTRIPGITIIGADSRVTADSNHRWGLAPFHYAPRVYAELSSTILTILNSNGRRQAHDSASDPDSRADDVSAFGFSTPPPPSRLALERHARLHGWDKLVDVWIDSIPVRADRIPNAYRIWRSARRYALQGLSERANQAVLLNELLHNSYIPWSAEISEEVQFGYGGIGVVLHPLSEIGKGATIGAGVTLAGAQKPSRPSWTRPGSVQVPRIDDYAYLSAGSKILGGVVVGPFAIVGANAVVTRDVPPGTVVAGAPARVIRTLDETTIMKYRATFLPLRALNNHDFLCLFSEYINGVRPPNSLRTAATGGSAGKI